MIYLFSLFTTINSSQVIYESKHITKFPSLNLSILSFISPHNNKKKMAMELSLIPLVYLLSVETLLIQIKKK